MSERILVRKIEQNLWQWREVSASGEWLRDAFYTGDINLLKENVEGRQVWLILPGQNVVSLQAEVSTKDRRQLLKILPYEIEDGIITAVEDLHFAFGEIDDEIIPLAYAEFDWLSRCIAELENIGANVQRCGVDYLQLARPEEGWTLLLENGVVYAHHGLGLGFTVEEAMAPVYMTALVAEGLPQSLRLFADDDQSLARLRSMLTLSETDASEHDVQLDSVDQMDQVDDADPVEESKESSPDSGRDIESHIGSYWDALAPAAPIVGDFRSGRLARKLPFDKWWKEFRYPVIGMAAAFLVAIGTTTLAVQQVEAKNKKILARTDEIFRTVVPSGSIKDPERQLRGLLGNAGASSAGSSNVVRLIAGVSPAIQNFGDVTVKGMRYSVEGGQLQLNIEAKSFDTFEALRAKIAEAGFSVDLKSANAYGDVHQAQLRVSEAG